MEPFTSAWTYEDIDEALYGLRDDSALFRFMTAETTRHLVSVTTLMGY